MGNRRKKAPKEHLAEPDPAPELQRHEAPAPEGLRADLAKLKLSALKKRARVAGIDQDTLDEADDAGDVKTFVIDLIVAAEAEYTGPAGQDDGELAAEEEALVDADEEEDVVVVPPLGSPLVAVASAPPAEALEPEPEPELEQSEEEQKVSQFCAVCGLDAPTAREQLESAGWDVQRAVDNFLAAQAAEERSTTFQEASADELARDAREARQRAPRNAREARQRALIAHIEETDRNSHEIRREDVATGVITTVADNFYEILDVTHDADKDTIKKAYQEGARLIHPDKCKLDGALEAFKKISEAWT